MMSQSFLVTQVCGIFLFVLQVSVDNLLHEVNAVNHVFNMLIVL